MNKTKFNKCLNIINFMLWSSLLLVVVFAPNDIDLRFACISSMAVILIEILLDILDSRGGK